MAITTQGDVVSYDIGAGSPVGLKETAVGVTIFTPGSTSPLGTAGNPLQTQTSALQTTPDLTTVKVKTTTSTTQVISTATAAQRTRVYRMRLEVSGAGVLTIQDGATVLEEFNIPAATRVIYDFSTRPWYMGSTNTIFQYVITTAVTVNAIFEITKVA